MEKKNLAYLPDLPSPLTEMIWWALSEMMRWAPSEMIWWATPKMMRWALPEMIWWAPQEISTAWDGHHRSLRTSHTTAARPFFFSFFGFPHLSFPFFVGLRLISMTITDFPWFPSISLDFLRFSSIFLPVNSVGLHKKKSLFRWPAALSYRMSAYL